MTETDRRISPDESYDWDSARARLAEDIERGYAQPWQPDQPEDSIMGVVVGVNEAAPTSYGPAPVVELETSEGGRFSVWLFSTVLRRAFERQQVQLGEVVLIRYLGKHRPDGGGNVYHNYALAVDRPAARGVAPDWRTIADRYGDEPLDEPRPTGKTETGNDVMYGGDDEIPF